MFNMLLFSLIQRAEILKSDANGKVRGSGGIPRQGDWNIGIPLSAPFRGHPGSAHSLCVRTTRFLGKERRHLAP